MVDMIDQIITYYERDDTDPELAADIIITLRDAEEMIFLHQTRRYKDAKDDTLLSDPKRKASDRPPI